MQNVKQRDHSIDILRCIGMLFIIVCHVGPPKVLFNLRNFDVTMLVFASGLSFAVADRNYLEDGKTYLRYLIKRLKRLLIPTWLFLSAYFLIFNLAKLIFPDKDISFSKSDYLQAYSLVSVEGYVWIIRIYILMAVISPLLYLIICKMKRKSSQIMFLFGLILLNEGLFFLLHDKTSSMFMLLRYLLPYMTGYGVVVLASFIANRLSNTALLLYGMGYLTVFFIALYLSGFPRLDTAKYPPRLLYSSYGIAISCFVLFICRIYKDGRDSVGNGLITWISRNSLLIYFYHAILVSSFDYKLIRLPVNKWYFKLVFICSVSSLLVWMHLIVKEKLYSIFMKG